MALNRIDRIKLGAYTIFMYPDTSLINFAPLHTTIHIQYVPLLFTPHSPK